MNRIVPLILAVALFMEQMDSTVIATALLKRSLVICMSGRSR